MKTATLLHSNNRIIHCLQCSHPHQYIDIQEKQRAECTRCGNELYRQMPAALDTAIALYLTALILFFIANIFPLLNISLAGTIEQNLVISSSIIFFQEHMPLLGILVLTMSIVFPLIVIIGNLYLLIPVRMMKQPPFIGEIFRMVQLLSHWSLSGVYLLALLIAIVKLQDLASVIPGYALLAYTVLVFVYAAARNACPLQDIWQQSAFQQPSLEQYRQHNNWLQCHHCHLLNPVDTQKTCKRCHTPLHNTRHHSIQVCWALVLTASIMIIPAHCYPIMTVISLGDGETNTIISGIIYLIEEGMWALGMIVFIASVLVPIFKLLILIYLLISVQKKSSWCCKDRTRLFRLTELVGVWSMVDVFLVGILSAAVRFSSLATIEPGIGTQFFAAMVIITLFAAYNFDPRLIWDNEKQVTH